MIHPNTSQLLFFDRNIRTKNVFKNKNAKENYYLI